MISLTAEQKTIEGIFCTTTEQYVIPAYQRPYSWSFDQFYELYRDLIGAYNENESYFLGNIIMARSKSYDIDGQNRVIDGQQRIITIWTLIKMLSIYLPDINSLQSSLYVIPWAGNKKQPKIHSEIWDNKDDEAIKRVLEYDKEKLESRYLEVVNNGVIDEKNCETKEELALLYLYQQFVVNQKEDFNLGSFAQFLMKRVTMLPIVQSADEQKDAENKALTIFETINNRGMDLEDADIFKARLYYSAYEEEQRKEFITMWVDFKTECNSIGLSVDDVFRYYSHVIRGRERITANEKRLRDFFSNESFSPLKTQTYKEVMEDLNKILNILKYLNNHRGNQDEVGTWLQIIYAYTNQYPTYAIIVYLYYHGVETEEEKGELVVNSLLKNNFCEEHLTITLSYQEPRWVLTVKDSSRDKFDRNERLTEYFNEAKLHIIKLLLLLTAVLYNGAKDRGDQRVLVLDDVLTSMDAANRAVFIKLLVQYFDEYQKIVLTHSVSFFNLAEHSFTFAYQQEEQWKMFQILEHPGNSVVEDREPQDNSFKINKDFLRGANLSVIGNRVRKHFEYLVREVSDLLYTGGLSETNHILSTIMSKKKMYYYFDTTEKKLKTVYDLIEELTAIIDAAPATPLKAQLSPVIAKYASGTELETLRNILSEMVIYQKVSMHPLSHSTGALPLTTQRECERSVSLLIQMENQIGKLIGRDMYSV